MAISYSSLAASVPNWQLLQTSTPSGVTSVTLSGLSGYSKYRLIGSLTYASNQGQAVYLQINGDSAGNYSYWGNYFTSGSSPGPIVGLSSTTYRIAYDVYGFASTQLNFNCDIDHALLLSNKVIVSSGSVEAVSVVQTQGQYKTTSAMTSVTIITSLSITGGTIELLGAN